MPRCERGGVYDLSGNLKEWVSDRLGNLRSVRGGSYATVLEGGLTCEQMVIGRTATSPKYRL